MSNFSQIKIGTVNDPEIGSRNPRPLFLALLFSLLKAKTNECHLLGDTGPQDFAMCTKTLKKILQRHLEYTHFSSTCK